MRHIVSTPSGIPRSCLTSSSWARWRGGGGGAEAGGAGGEHEVLGGGIEGGAGRRDGSDARYVNGGDDEDGDLREVVRQMVGGGEGPGGGRAGQRGLAEGAVGGVPAFEVPLGDLRLGLRVPYDDEVPGLAVAAAGGLHGRVQQRPDELVRHGVGLEATHRALAVDGFEYLHGATSLTIPQLSTQPLRST